MLLSLFGPFYASEGVDTLRLLSLAALPLSIVLLYLTRARVHREMRSVLLITGVTGGGALVLGTLLVSYGGATGTAARVPPREHDRGCSPRAGVAAHRTPGN